MNQANNVNGIDNFPKENNIVNDNDRERYRKSKSVDLTAQDLVNKLGNPEGYKFYCKVAWRLPPAVIYTNLEQAMKGRSPVRLFTYLCKKCMS